MEKSSKVRKLRCDVCGTEIMVSSSGDYKWHPIYCCGLEVHGKEGKPAPRAMKKTTPAGKKTGATPKSKSAPKRAATRTTSPKKTTKRPVAKKPLPRKAAPVSRAKKK